MNEMNDKVDGEDKSIIQMDSQSAPVQTQNTDAGDEKERAIAKAALSIAELGMLHLSHSHVYHNLEIPVSLLEGLPDESPVTRPPEDYDSLKELDDGEVAQDVLLRSINAISAYQPFIQCSRVKVTKEMENMVGAGLKTLVSTNFFDQCVPLPNGPEPNSSCFFPSNSI